MIKRIFLLLLIALGAFILFFLVTRIKDDGPKNGFKRTIKTFKFEKPNVFEIPERSFNFVGKPNKDVLLYSHRHPMKLYKIKDSINTLKSIYIKAPSAFDTNSRYIIMRNGPSSDIYISNSEGALLIFGNKDITSYKIPLKFTDNCTPISNSSIVVRSIEKKEQDKSMSLVKINLSDQPKESKRYILPKHGDGVFGNDGILRYDKKGLKFIYTFFYLGEFLCLDTNLNLIYKGKTIDTVRSPTLKLGSVKNKLKNGFSTTGITQITPPHFVNIDFAINNDLLYIISHLRADNESYSDFNNNQPIDVYSLKNGKYLYSFYIPKYKELELKKLEIINNQLFGIFGQYLIKYEFKN